MRNVGGGRTRQHGERLLDRLLVEPRAGQQAHQVRAAADRQRTCHVRRRHAGDRLGGVQPAGGQLLRRRRVVLEEAARQPARADLQRVPPIGPLPRLSDGQLRRSAADVGDRHRSLAVQLRQRGRAEERHLGLGLLGQDLERKAGQVVDLLRQLAGVRGGAQDRRADDRDQPRAQPPRGRHLRRHGLGGLVDLRRRDDPLLVDRAPDERELAHRRQLPQRAVLKLGDEQPRRVGADVDAGAAQGLHHLCS